MKFFYIYVLLSFKHGNFYTGFTEDLEKKLIEHNAVKAITLWVKGFILTQSPSVDWREENTKFHSLTCGYKQTWCLRKVIWTHPHPSLIRQLTEEKGWLTKLTLHLIFWQNYKCKDIIANKSLS